MQILKEFRAIYFLLVFSTEQICLAQNLVANPSFETTINCPVNPSGACQSFIDVLENCCQDWSNLGCGSADYFNSCNNSINGNVGVPFNDMGYQNARTGSAYTGLYTQIISLPCYYREYITSTLVDTLTNNVNYYVEFYVSVKDAYPFPTPGSSDALSALFTTGPPDTSSMNYGCTPLPNIAQINNPDGNYISDTANWVKISGNFIAVGGENQISIGNFKDTSAIHGLAYFYIDDILVIADSLRTNIAELSDKNISVYPNPFFNTTTLSFEDQQQNTQINILDVQGSLIREIFFTGKELILEKNTMCRGLYFIQFKLKNKSTIFKKLIVL